jgi:AbrB family looped-hinge helix DNA binding protein
MTEFSGAILGFGIYWTHTMNGVHAMAAKTAQTRVSESGRLSIPADMRRELGLEKGGPVSLEIVDGGLRIRTMSEVRARIRKMADELGWTGKVTVDDFLEWKRNEAAREIAEMDSK